jgi:hypothetical protein
MASENTLAFGDTNPVAKKIRELLNVGDFEEVGIILPEFGRADSRTITYVPTTVAEYDALKSAPDDILRDIGLQKWDETTWLYPAEWYDYIPEGYEVFDILGKTEPFQKGTTDSDRRFGCLAYGLNKT